MNDRTIQMIALALGGDESVTPRQREFILAACRNPAQAVDNSPLEMVPAATVAEVAAALCGIAVRPKTMRACGWKTLDVLKGTGEPAKPLAARAGGDALVLGRQDADQDAVESLVDADPKTVDAR